MRARRAAATTAFAVLAATILAACGQAAHRGRSGPGSLHGGGANASSSSSAPGSPKSHAKPQPPPSSPGATAARLMGLPAPPSSPPLPGYLLIADRNNDRLIVVAPDHRIVWRFPGGHGVGRGRTFSEPDDAFLSPDGRSLITNEEFADTIAQISLGPPPHISWEYGHFDAPGSAHGYLSHPDDAYLLPDANIQVADIINCRVLVIDRAAQIVRHIGHAGDCVHEPPRALSSPNGDTPLADGGVLVTEIGGWVDRFSRSGRLVFALRTPTTYPSDAQLTARGNVLVAAYNSPGRIDEISPHGRILWTYGPTSGAGLLDMPSLAVPLSDGLIAVTDDWHHRVVVISRASKRIVWQYGHLGVPGKRPGYLDKPDGLALIAGG